MSKTLKLYFYVKRASLTLPKKSALSELGQEMVNLQKNKGETRKIFSSALTAQYIVANVWELEDLFADTDGEYDATSIKLTNFNFDGETIVFSAEGFFKLPMAIKINSEEELQALEAEKEAYFDNGVTLEAPDLLSDPFSDVLMIDGHDGLGIQFRKLGLFG